MFDWPTFAYNTQRTGESPDTTISKSNIGTLAEVWHSAGFGTFDFDAQTQPVLATGVSVSGTSHNIVYVAGGSGTVYAFDAFNGTVLWKRYIGQGTYSCDGVTTSYYGAQGTPVIDRTNGVLYVPDGLHQVHALTLGTGQEAAGWPVNLLEPNSDDGSSSNLHEFAHTALTLLNGKIYAGLGSTCDITPWKGRVVEIDVASRTLQNTFYTAFNQGGAYSGGGVWGWGGVSTDGSALYFGVGNTDTATQGTGFTNTSDETAGYGEHIVKLGTDLGFLQANLPATIVPNPWPTDPNSDSDLDLSGTPVLFQPTGCPPLLAVQGKAGYLVIYNRNNLPAGPIASFQFSWSEDYSHYIGNVAYSSATGYLYAAVPTTIATTNAVVPGMAILQPTTGCSGFKLVANPAFGPDSFLLGVALDGPPPAEPRALPRSTTTVVNGIAFMGTPDGVLHAVDAANGNVLWDSTKIWNAATTSDQIRYGPVVSGGWLYVVESESATLWALNVTGAVTSSAGARRTAQSLVRTAPFPAPLVTRRGPRHH